MNGLILIFCFRDKQPVHVVVDPILCNILRPHQREVIYNKTLNVFISYDSDFHRLGLSFLFFPPRELNLCMNV